MATVTHTYIREMDYVANLQTDVWPVGIIQDFLDSGAVISNSEVRIPEGEPDYVEGKNRTRVTRVYRSLQDKNDFETAGAALTARRAFATAHNARKINEVTS